MDPRGNYSSPTNRGREEYSGHRRPSQSPSRRQDEDPRNRGRGENIHRRPSQSPSRRQNEEDPRNRDSRYQDGVIHRRPSQSHSRTHDEDPRGRGREDVHRRPSQSPSRRQYEEDPRNQDPRGRGREDVHRRPSQSPSRRQYEEDPRNQDPRGRGRGDDVHRRSSQSPSRRQFEEDTRGRGREDVRRRPSQSPSRRQNEEDPRNRGPQSHSRSERPSQNSAPRGPQSPHGGPKPVRTSQISYIEDITHELDPSRGSMRGSMRAHPRSSACPPSMVGDNDNNRHQSHSQQYKHKNFNKIDSYFITQLGSEMSRQSASSQYNSNNRNPHDPEFIEVPMSRPGRVSDLVYTQQNYPNNNNLGAPRGTSPGGTTANNSAAPEKSPQDPVSAGPSVGALWTAFKRDILNDDSADKTYVYDQKNQDPNVDERAQQQKSSHDNRDEYRGEQYDNRDQYQPRSYDDKDQHQPRSYDDKDQYQPRSDDDRDQYRGQQHDNMDNDQNRRYQVPQYDEAGNPLMTSKGSIDPEEEKALFREHRSVSEVGQSETEPATPSNAVTNFIDWAYQMSAGFLPASTEAADTVTEIPLLDTKEKLIYFGFVSVKTGRHTDLEHVLDSLLDPNTVDEDQRSLLSWAARMGHDKCVRLLLSRGAHVDFIGADVVLTPLVEACKNGHAQVVETLLHAGSSVHQLTRMNHTPLMYASANGHIGCAQLLIDHGANFHAVARKESDHRGSTKHWGFNQKQSEYVDWQDAAEGTTALHLAARYNRHLIVSTLLEFGAHVNHRDDLGRTAFYWACDNGCLESVHALFRDQKTNLEIPDGDGNSPFMWAVRKNRYEVVKFLIERGINVHYCPANDPTRTAYNWAMQYSDIRIADLMDYTVHGRKK